MPELQIVVSAPEHGSDYPAGLVPASRYKPFQAFLGADAQLAAFRGVAAHHGVGTLLAPFPQLYTERAAPAPADGRVATHVRFGPAFRARVLKGLNNVLVSAEDPGIAPVMVGLHPFADPSRVPAAMGRAYGLETRRTPLSRAGGGAVEWRDIPEVFAVHDLAAVKFVNLDADEPDDLLAGFGAAGVDVHSIAEFDLGRWLARSGFEGIGRDFRRAVVDDMAKGTEGAGFVLLPFNLAHPGSAVAGLLRSLLQLAAAEGSPTPVIFPFNVGLSSGEVLLPLLSALNAQAAKRSMLRRIFVARLFRLEAAASLGALVSAAWLDASDPEHAWVERRLRALGVPTVVFGEDRAGQGLKPDLSRLSVYRDLLGERLVSTPEFGIRAISAAIRLTRAERNRPVTAPRFSAPDARSAAIIQELAEGA